MSPIDVADDESVARAAQDIAAHEGRIDVLINNAGILGSHAPAEELTGPDATEIFNTNVAGIVRVTHAFVPLLRRSAHPAVINVSSGMGSFALTHDPDARRVQADRAALHRLQGGGHDAHHAVREGPARTSESTRPTPATPRPTSTGTADHQTVTEGTDAIVALATESPDAGTGRFIDRFGPVRS